MVEVTQPQPTILVLQLQFAAIEDGLSGFLFSNLTGAGLTGAVARAMEAFRSKRSFRQMRDHAMAKRFDWRRPSFRYADVYARALAA